MACSCRVNPFARLARRDGKRVGLAGSYASVELCDEFVPQFRVLLPPSNTQIVFELVVVVPLVFADEEVVHGAPRLFAERDRSATGQYGRG